MSTAANMAHTPHTAHPLPLREQAFTLHCQGLRSPAIAEELGVPERTIRSWIAAALDSLQDDLQLSRRQQLLLAVERQHQFTAVAWQQFEREAAARDALLDAALQTLLAASDPSNLANASAAHPFHLHLPASTPAPRYLSLILQAHKETNRLFGLHSPARFQLLTSESLDSTGFLNTLAADPDIAAETATGASPLPMEERGGGEVPIPAESATAPILPSVSASSPSTALNPPSCSSVSQAPSVAGIWGQGPAIACLRGRP